MPSSHKRGDKVYVDPSWPNVGGAVLGRSFTVERVNPKNVVCSADDGGRGINYPAESLKPVPADGKIPMGRPFVPIEFFEVGELVNITTAYKDVSTTTPLVVIKDSGADRVNLVRLGGDEGRYLRWPRTGLVRRDLDWLEGHVKAGRL